MESKKKVTLITGLKTKEMYVDNHSGVIEWDTEFSRKILPIHKFARRLDVGSAWFASQLDGGDLYATKYIAITNEVEDLLQTPMNLLFEKNKNLEDEINTLTIQAHKLNNDLRAFKQMSFWNRVKFLFKGEV